MARSLGAMTEVTSYDAQAAKPSRIDVYENTTGVDLWISAQLQLSALAASATTISVTGSQHNTSTGTIAETHQVSTNKTSDSASLSGISSPPLLIAAGDFYSVFVKSTNAGDNLITVNGIAVDVSVASDVQKVGGETPLTQSDVQGGYKYTS